MIVSGPKGTIQLDKADSIIAGTNLGGKGKGGENNGPINYDKMATAMSKANLKVNTHIRHDAFSDYNTSGGDGEYQSQAKYASNFI